MCAIWFRLPNETKNASRCISTLREIKINANSEFATAVAAA